MKEYSYKPKFFSRLSFAVQVACDVVNPVIEEVTGTMVLESTYKMYSRQTP